MTATVSVCVPVYQGERHLRATLDSVLAQEGVAFDVVVVDNASTDGTARILASYSDPRLRVVTNPRTIPMTANFVAAVAATSGDFVKLCCADDLLLPGALASQSAVLRTRPEISVVASRRLFIDDDDRAVGPVGLRRFIGRHGGRAIARRFVRWGINPVGEPACVMFRRGDYEAVGGWGTDMLYPSDIDTWFRLLRRGDLFGQPDALAAFRLAREAHSQTHEDQNHEENLELIRRVAKDPYWRVGRRDRVLSALLQPIAWRAWRVQRRRLFVSAALPDTHVIDEHRAGGR